MGTAIWIIIALAMLAIGYAVANVTSKKNAASRANTIIEEARREAEMIKESKLLKAKEEEMKIIGDAERAAGQRMQKAQANEARLKQREIQLNQQQGEQSRRKKELENLRVSLENREQLLESRNVEVDHLYRQAQEELV